MHIPLSHGLLFNEMQLEAQKCAKQVRIRKQALDGTGKATCNKVHHGGVLLKSLSLILNKEKLD